MIYVNYNCHYYCTMDDDKKRQKLCELMSNNSSREIIKLLSTDELYNQEIVNRLGLNTTLVLHHLKKLKELKLLKITNKSISTDNMHKHYSMKNPYLLDMLDDFVNDECS